MDEYESDDELGDSYAMRSKQKPGSGRPSGPKSAGYGGGGGGGGKAPTRKGGKEAPTRLEVRDFMDLMDRELAHTAVGQSFTREGDEYEEVRQCSHVLMRMIISLVTIATMPIVFDTFVDKLITLNTL